MENLDDRWLEELVNIPSSDTLIAHGVAFRVGGYMTEESHPQLSFVGHVGRTCEVDVGPYSHLQHSMKPAVQPHRHLWCTPTSSITGHSWVKRVKIKLGAVAWKWPCRVSGLGSFIIAVPGSQNST